MRPAISVAEEFRDYIHLRITHAGLPDLATWDVRLAPKSRHWRPGDLLATSDSRFGSFGVFLERISRAKQKGHRDRRLRRWRF